MLKRNGFKNTHLIVCYVSIVWIQKHTSYSMFANVIDVMRAINFG